jgi:GNAT superfamily N-acetyltransferase
MNDASRHDVRIRKLLPTDDLDSLTELLHRAYLPLLQMGLNYTATQQDTETTKQRVNEGSCFVAELNGKIVGTVTLSFEPAEWINDYYRKPGVWRFGQFAVEPDLQGHGIGRLLLEHIERHAMEAGAAELALDTAIPAKHLIEFYERFGYQVVDHCQWPGHTYASVVMSKRLTF